jgi:2'-5' RNA ligase
MKTAFRMFTLSAILTSTLPFATAVHAGEAPGILPIEASLFSQIESAPRPQHGARVSPGSLNLTVPFGPINELFEQVKTSFSLPALRNRGEAHITVITPPEFDASFSAAFTPSQVMEMMQAEGLNDAKFTAVCLGQVAAEIQGETQKAFFVLVDSPDLVRIRQALRDKLVAAGGDASAFDPSDFHPHITVGFTLRDLQESDNIVKDIRACDPVQP